jgi:hypothetical protein
MSSPRTVSNIGNGYSPSPELINNIKKLKSSAPVREYLSNNGRVLLALLNAGAGKKDPLVGNVFVL